MKLKIRNIIDRGATDERLVLLVKEDCDIGKFFAFITTKSDEKIIYTNIKHPFWFPDKLVKKGDLVVLYTKVGSSSFKVNEDGSSSHFYYRNLKSPILVENYFALIIEVNTWAVE